MKQKKSTGFSIIYSNIRGSKMIVILKVFVYIFSLESVAKWGSVFLIIIQYEHVPSNRCWTSFHNGYLTVIDLSTFWQTYATTKQKNKTARHRTFLRVSLGLLAGSPTKVGVTVLEKWCKIQGNRVIEKLCHLAKFKVSLSLHCLPLYPTLTKEALLNYRYYWLAKLL